MSKVLPSDDVELKDFNEKDLNSTPNNTNFLKRSFNLSPNAILGVIIGSSSLILVIGLVSGLVLRPDNCISRPIISTIPVVATTISQATSALIITTITDPLVTVTQTDPGTIANNNTSIHYTTSITTSTTTTQTTQTKTIPTLTTATKLSTASISIDDFRLPNLIKPFNYNLELKTYFTPFIGNNNAFDAEYFEGTVRISFDLEKPTNLITLHVDDSLAIYQIKIFGISNNLVTSAKNESTNYKQYQLYQISLDRTLAKGDYVLEMTFSGKFGLFYGLYKTKYIEDKITKVILATQFKPKMARTVFPCFDEPSFKATYDITLEHPDETIALSNWPVKSTTVIPDANRVQTVFDTTFKMSSYLAAWAIIPDDFNYVEKLSSQGKKIRVYAKKSAMAYGLADFAVETAKKTLDFFENDYFKISDAVPPKIDLIAFPDFIADGMEHWGLIGFSEKSLLFTPKEHSIIVKQEAALIIAHELAHFWFGNYVTCGWWEDLWLNEAMATFLQYKAIEAIYSEMDITDQYIVDRMIPVMHDDGYDYSQKVLSEVKRPEDIDSLFNLFTYDKGASILFMLESTVGKENFKDALIKYLKANAFGTGVADEFYNSLVLPTKLTEAGVAGADFMTDFLDQINYPLVTVSLTHNDATSTNVSFVQKRFLHSVLNIDLANYPSRFNYTWKLYIQCKVGGIYNSADLDDDSQHLSGTVKEFDFYLGDSSGSIKLNERFSWIKCNKDFRSYYLTSYSDYNFKALEYVLANGPKNTFSIGDRAHIIHSAYSLSYAGLESYSTPNYLSSYMEFHESDYVPWKVYFWHLEKLATLLEHRASFKYLREFSIQSARALANEADLEDLWDGTGDHTEQMLKIYAIEFLCRFQDELCLNKATELFNTIPKTYFFNPNSQNNPVSPNYRAEVYKYHIQNTNDYNDWFLVDIHYYETNDPHENHNALQALSHHRSIWLLDGLLSELLSINNTIKSGQFFQVLSLVGENTAGRHQAWMFVRRYFDVIVSEYGNGVGFAYAVKKICESFSYFFLLEEMNQFFSTTADGDGYLIRKITEDIVINNIYWIAIREKDVIENFVAPNKLKLQKQ